MNKRRIGCCCAWAREFRFRARRIGFFASLISIGVESEVGFPAFLSRSLQRTGAEPRTGRKVGARQEKAIPGTNDRRELQREYEVLSEMRWRRFGSAVDFGALRTRLSSWEGTCSEGGELLDYF